MTEIAKSSFGDKPLLGSSAIKWTMRRGVFPNIEELPMAPDDAKTFLANPGPHTLEIRPEQGNPVIVTNLWVLDVKPGPNAYISHVTVADRRWFWSYGHFLRRYNVRRNVGVKRTLDNTGFAVPFDTAFKVGWWKWSLKDKTNRWNAFTMLNDFLKELAQVEFRHHGQTFKHVIDDRIGSKIQTMPIEDVDVDESADQAFRRVLSFMPEADVYVDYNGDVVVYSRAAGDEAGIVKALVPEIVDRGHTDLTLSELVRPKEVHVYFTMEVEVRHDFVEVAKAAGATVTDDLGDARTLENVLSITDYQLTVNNRTLPQNTWITMDEGFRSWGNLPLLGVALDHDIVQQAFIPQMDLWTPLGLAGERPDNNGDLKPWMGRLQEVQGRYRQTFRLNPNIMDRTLTFRNYMVGTVDPQRGTRAPSRVWGDYCVMYTQRSIYRNRAKGSSPGQVLFAMNRAAFDGTNLDSNAEPSPAIVSIVDHDQGIIHFNYVGTDPLSGDTRVVLPSQMVDGSVPRAFGHGKGDNISFDTIINAQNPPRLSPSFKAATVLTHVPASPNSKRQLYKVVVKPSEVGKFLPENARKGLDVAKGPVMEIRIGPNVEPARVVWRDGRSNDIEKIFGIQEGEPDLTGIVTNDAPAGDLRRGGSLRQIALSEAARLYASLADRYEGSMTGHMNGGVKLAGWADHVTHTLSTGGEVTTEVVYPESIEKMTLESFLDSNTRAVVHRLVQPE